MFQNIINMNPLPSNRNGGVYRILFIYLTKQTVEWRGRQRARGRGKPFTRGLFQGDVIVIATTIWFKVYRMVQVQPLWFKVDCVINAKDDGNLGPKSYYTALQAGKWRVRFPVASLELFIDIILPVAMWRWG
jgi:hypothetical protein